MTALFIDNVLILYGNPFSIFYFHNYSPECRHADQDYAYNKLDEMIHLGSPYGLLMLSGTGGKCIKEIWNKELTIIYYQEYNNITCSHLIEFLKENEILKSQKRLRLIQIFGRTVYYAYRNENQIRHINLTNNFNVINPQIDHPLVQNWIEQTARSYQIEAFAFIRTSKESPKLPSALVTLVDNKFTRVFKFIRNDPDELNSISYQVGVCDEKVNAIFMEDNLYKNEKDIIVFFGKYYGTIKVKISERNSRTHLKPFPIIPMQYLYGCPVNFCWWPHIDDILYYDRAYYFFQDRWMFRMIEGSPKPTTLLEVEHVYKLKHIGIDFTIDAVYYDYSLQTPVLIWKSSNREYSMTQIDILELNQGNRVRFLPKELGTHIAITEPHLKILTAYMLPEETILWTCVLKLDKIWLRGYVVSESISGSISWKHEYTTPFEQMQSMFYNYNTQTLYIISGFFLYAYEEPKVTFDSRCLVTYAATFFNCSERYYRNLDLKNYVNQEEYFKEAKQRHRGKLLHGKCNFRNSLPYNTEFTDEINDSDDADDDDNSVKHLWKRILKHELTMMIMAICSGIVITIITFYCLSKVYYYRMMKRRSKRSANVRRSQENKLKDYLKQRYKGFMKLHQMDSTSTSIGGTVSDSSLNKRKFFSLDGRNRKTPK
ncbi:hypothetical protein RDWZM_002293 [Blomia tropicalis]|uniref:Uncharacterized protein n=1 Tax=Blomia tropicalis TaxID=40697 RepID=A0A9Q0RPS9_BLOTA|nr:hypothetical protein RDWZM_002293 [Blomia tropicalis]